LLPSYNNEFSYCAMHEIIAQVGNYLSSCYRPIAYKSGLRNLAGDQTRQAGVHPRGSHLQCLEWNSHHIFGCPRMMDEGSAPGGMGHLAEMDKRMEAVRRNSEYLASDDVTWKGNYERNDLVAERQCEPNFAEEKAA